jgi:subtilisin family serine protease
LDDSKNIQNGKNDQWPTESIWGWYSGKDSKWGIKVKKNPGAKDKTIELFFNFNGTYNLEFDKPAGSLTIPADSEMAIAVSAIPWESGMKDYYYTYSSRGPTTDDRIKPDIAAASSVSNETYGFFGGTSASTPHVAGAIALLYNKTPFTIEQITLILESRADDWGAVGKDNIFGVGKLDLDD